jgi:hypothetical protein
MRYVIWIGRVEGIGVNVEILHPQKTRVQDDRKALSFSKLVREDGRKKGADPPFAQPAKGRPPE